MNKATTLFRNLDYLTVRNTDNGRYFTDTTRLDRIEELLNESPFSFVEKADLFCAFSQVPFEELGDDTLIISSHVDFKRETENCFSDTSGEKEVIGTYDNSATNAAIVELMTHVELPKNVLVAFTGDEELYSRGACSVIDFINRLGIKASCIVLDVTEEGYMEKASFSVENAYCDDGMLEKVVEWVLNQSEKYYLVPAEEEQLESGIIKKLPEKFVSKELAELDEAWDYSKRHIECFSFCLPTKLMDPEGKYAPGLDPDEAMHSSKGLKIRKRSIIGYTESLNSIINVLA